MRKLSEMYTASRIQYMAQTRKTNVFFVTNLLFNFLKKVLFWLSASSAPTVGPLGSDMVDLCFAYFFLISLTIVFVKNTQ